MKDIYSSKPVYEKLIGPNPLLKNPDKIIHNEVKILPKAHLFNEVEIHPKKHLFNDIFGIKKPRLESQKIDPVEYFQDIQEIEDDVWRLVECQKRIAWLKKYNIGITAARILDPEQSRPVEEILANIKTRISTVANGLLNPSELTLREYVAFVLLGGDDFTMEK